MPPAGMPETGLLMSDAARTRLLEDDCRRLAEANEFLEHLLAASPSMVFGFHPETHLLIREPRHPLVAGLRIGRSARHRWFLEPQTARFAAAGEREGRRGQCRGLYARADRQRLKQVLVNLVSNAVKYNRDDGQVRVSCVLEGGMVRILVSDTGPGIPPHNRARLFQPYERRGAEQSSVEGTGLGLAVTKGLTEAMAGRIGFESPIDVGTTFWIELAHSAAPAPRQTEVPAAADDRPEASVGTVLYVEDNRSNIRLLERLLARRPGVVLLTASTGERRSGSSPGVVPISSCSTCICPV